MSKILDFLDRHKGLVSKKQPWMSYWQELSDVLLPNQADFTTTQTPGTQRGAGIYDGTPRLALRDLAGTLDGLIKPKSSSWFDVELDDANLMEYDEVKLWLEDVKDRMWNAIYRKDSRFIQRSGEVDVSLACFGWGPLWISENRQKNALLFKSFHINSVCIDENEDGVVDVISIEEMLTPRQAQAWYDRLKKPYSKKLEDAMRKGASLAEKSFKFVQLVLPNKEYDKKMFASNKGKPFSTCLIDQSSEEILYEDGFHEFPAAIPRWETSPGEVYARSPGMIALPDAKTLQAMGKTLLIGGQRAVDPPIWVVNDSVLSPLRTFPGGITILDTSNEGNPVGTFPTSLNLPIGRDMQADYRRQVEAAFFKNIFNLPIETRQMTATEIIARKEEFIRVIGPVFGRLEADYIGHIVERVFGIMMRAGQFAPPPDIIADEVNITFKFQSPIQKARKQMEIVALGQSLQFIAPLAETQPEILDNFDGDSVVRDAPEWGGLPTKWLRTIKDRDARRQSAQKTGAGQQALADAGPLSQSIKNLASAEEMLTPEV